jgi:uncharacterized membrane protein
MERSGIIIAIAVALLFIANIMFLESSYFNPIEIATLNLIGLASAALFFIAYNQRGKSIRLGFKLNAYALIAVVAFFLLIAFQLIGLAVLITIAALYIIAYLSKRMKGSRLQFAIFAIIIITSLLAYWSVYTLRGTSWKGIDEIAYNYFAAYKLLHGSNPYTASMLPILTTHNIPPTYLLNGSIEMAYDYPAFSFLPILFLGLFNLHSVLIFIAVVAFITTLSAFIVYRKSRYNILVLLPLAAWLVFTYLFIGTIDQYIAVSVFLVVAYTERKRPILSGICIGLAASTIQLAWFAIPFIFILMLREEGSNKLFKSIAVSALTFLAINGYFIAIAPHQFFTNIFGLFGTSKLLLAGTNIMQLLVTSYGVPLWYPATLSAIVLLASMVLFYFYTATLRPFIALVPAFIFMLSWHNFLMYGLAFVPLIIIICYEKDGKGAKDLVRNKKYIAVAFEVLIIASVVLALYAHSVYVSSNTLEIKGITPLVQSAQSANSYEINGMRLSLANNDDHYENVSFFIINRYNLKDGIFLSSYLGGVPPHSIRNYTLNYTAKNITGNTEVYIMAFSTDYIRSGTFGINSK